MISTYDQQFVFAKLEQNEFLNLIHLNQSLSTFLEPLSILEAEQIFIWAITDKSPPIKSGIAVTENELRVIAKAHNIEGFAHQEYLKQFAEVVRYNFPLISHTKKPNDRYSVAVWA